ncbi:MAG TPA: M28 family metallopeptidase [Bacillus sp. (in: firmicutes)]|nr:M28 family metallopeptidase [Bacillus sp. (in: firmicutes)]
MKSKFNMKVAVAALAASMTLGSIQYVSAEEINSNGKSSYSEDQKVVARVSAERAIEHICYLSKNIGTRPGGLEGEKLAADYVASVLKSYGYNVQLQEFPVADQYIGNITFKDGTKWEVGAAPNAVISKEALEGDLLFVNGGENLADFPTETEGKIVVMYRASTTDGYRTQVDNAITKGAKGVILSSVMGSRGNYGQTFNPSLATKKDIPVFGAAYIHGEWAKEQIQKGNTKVSLTAESFTNLKSVNVIASKKPKNHNADTKAVVLGAHIDSVVGAPGGNDNASGVGLMLELARVYKGYNTDKEIRFIGFGSEERGLLGSKYYVEQLSDDEKKNIEAMFSPDMVATSYGPAKNLYAMTVDGKPNVITDASVAAGGRLGNSDILPGQFGSSDHVHFHRAGIPSALFIWMGIDSWDPLVYHIEKVYHTPQDTIEDNISEERMQSALDIIGSAYFSLVRKDVPALNKDR